ncbi:hypothetical protein ACET3X_004576 [Alternaria dauci]|uniref:Uncharacterized protein n=1 Tax=Alternaria dauci TaxID=48095 RepID=A0ABR3UNA3_9PLEO
MSEKSSIESQLYTALRAYNASHSPPDQPPNGVGSHPYSRPADEALQRLDAFQKQNPIRATTVTAAPSPAPGLPSPSMPPNASVSQFHPSRMNIPPTAYAPAYASAYQTPPASHMPPLTLQMPPVPPSAPPAYEPMVHPEPLGCITLNMISDRIYLVLRDNLSEWWIRNPDALQKVCRSPTDRLASLITYSGPRGLFGPNGIQSLKQIDLYIGREGTRRYLCLAVRPENGELAIIFKGDLCEKDGKDPVYDKEMMEMCKDGFNKGLAKLLESIIAELQKKANQNK